MAATATLKVAASGIWLAGRSTAMVLVKSTTTASLSLPQPETQLTLPEGGNRLENLFFASLYSSEVLVFNPPTAGEGLISLPWGDYNFLLDTPLLAAG